MIIMTIMITKIIIARPRWRWAGLLRGGRKEEEGKKAREKRMGKDRAGSGRIEEKLAPLRRVYSASNNRVKR